MIDTENLVGNTLSWLVVKDMKAALKYYTEVLGFTIDNQAPEYHWAELKAPEGAAIALAQETPNSPYKAGMNAVVTLAVKDIEAAFKDLVEGGTQVIGEIEEIPGHVKMVTFTDPDGNFMQLAQRL